MELETYAPDSKASAGLYQRGGAVQRDFPWRGRSARRCRLCAADGVCRAVWGCLVRGKLCGLWGHADYPVCHVHPVSCAPGQ